jgi:CSLREA domain-containing protein
LSGKSHYDRPFGRRNRHRSATRRSTTSPHSRCLRFEPLEDRRLLSASPIIVTTLADTVDFSDGQTSLREAIFAANTVPGADTIEFAPSLIASGPAKIVLTQGELKVTDSLSIIGPGADLLTIDASGNDPTPGVADGKGSRIFNIDDGNPGTRANPTLLDVSLSGLTLTGGDADAGGAIFDSENLTISDCVLTGNASQSNGGAVGARYGSLSITDSTIAGNRAADGGGICLFAFYYGGSELVLTNSTVSNNTSSDQGGGLAIFAPMTISGSSISGNSAYVGGGIYTIKGDGDSAVSGTTISNNSAQFKGGGVFIALVSRIGTTTITGCSITGNTAHDSGGGIDFSTVLESFLSPSFLALSVEQSTISGNTADQYGGGMNLRDGRNAASPFSVSLDGCSITDNTAVNRDGGGIWASVDELTVTGCDVSHNTAGQSAGGLFVSRIGTITGSTISDNAARLDGGGISFSGSQLSVSWTTIAHNTADTGGGIRSSASVALNSSIVDSNSSRTGGGIYAVNLTAIGSNVINNTSVSDGGGIYAGGTVSLTGSVVSWNRTTSSFGGSGGGIVCLTTLILNASSIESNSATGKGGGIFGANLTATGSAITNNASAERGGGVYLSGTASLAMCVISGNSTSGATGQSASGGGIFAEAVNATQSAIVGNKTSGIGDSGGGLKVGAASLTNCTIAGNSTSGNGAQGGGIVATSQLTLTQSTLSGNSTSGQSAFGGGAVVSGEPLIGATLIISDSTITGNHANHSSASGGGLYLSNVNKSIYGSIIAGNTAGGGKPDLRFAGTITLRYSLIGNSSGTSLVEAPLGSSDQNHNLIGGPVHGVIDAKLGPLVNNGGPTFLDGSRMLTRALLPGSPAINAGDPAAMAGVGSTPQYDQRGAPFGRVVGGRIDMGAVESQPNPLPGDYNFDGIVNAADYTVWRDTLGSTTDLRADSSGPTIGIPNGIVDQADYDFWNSHFGNMLSGNGAASVATTTASTAIVGSSDSEYVEAVTAPTENSVTPQAVRRGTTALSSPAALSSHDDSLLAWLTSQTAHPSHCDGWADVRASHDLPSSDAQQSALATIDDAFAGLNTYGLRSF